MEVNEEDEKLSQFGGTEKEDIQNQQNLDSFLLSHREEKEK